MFRNLSAGAIGIGSPFSECLGIARKAAFQGVDVDFFQAGSAKEAEAVVQELADHGLRPGASGLPVDFRRGREEYHESFQRFRRAAPILAATGVKRVLTWLLPFSEELPYLENFRQHADRLSPVAEVLYENGCALGLEFVGTPSMRDGHKYSFIHTLDQVLELCGTIEHPNVGILLDSWHWYVSGGTVEDIRKLSGSQVVGVHVNDAPAGVPIAEQKDNVRCLPGETGVIDLTGFLQTLRTIEYDGPVTVEPFSQRLRSLAPQEAARETSDALRKVWREAGLAE